MIHSVRAHAVLYARPWGPRQNTKITTHQEQLSDKSHQRPWTPNPWETRAAHVRLTPSHKKPKRALKHWNLDDPYSENPVLSQEDIRNPQTRYALTTAEQNEQRRKQWTKHVRHHTKPLEVFKEQDSIINNRFAADTLKTKALHKNKQQANKTQQYSTIQYNTDRTMQYKTIQYKTIQYKTI